MCWRTERENERRRERERIRKAVSTPLQKTKEAFSYFSLDTHQKINNNSKSLNYRHYIFKNFSSF